MSASKARVATRTTIYVSNHKKVYMFHNQNTFILAMLCCASLSAGCNRIQAEHQECPAPVVCPEPVICPAPALCPKYAECQQCEATECPVCQDCQEAVNAAMDAFKSGADIANKSAEQQQKAMQTPKSTSTTPSRSSSNRRRRR